MKKTDIMKLKISPSSERNVKESDTENVSPISEFDSVSRLGE